MFSHAVNREYNPVDSGTTPNLFRIEDTGLSWKLIDPLLGSMTPAINLSRVVLPAPLPPTKPITWPELISKSTCVRALTSLKLLPTLTRESNVSLTILTPNLSQSISDFCANSTSTPPVLLGWTNAIKDPCAPFLGSLSII